MRSTFKTGRFASPTMCAKLSDLPSAAARPESRCCGTGLRRARRTNQVGDGPRPDHPQHDPTALGDSPRLSPLKMPVTFERKGRDNSGGPPGVTGSLVEV